MEKLNEYLQSLLSSCSDELRLEPDKNPYLVAENRTTDVSHVPLQGTQISTMVFPLIPASTKSELPHKSEVEFVLPHQLGNFNFNVQKSPAGFIVTIRPVIGDSDGSITIPKPLPASPPLPVGYTAETASPFAAEYELETEDTVSDQVYMAEAAAEPVPQFSYDLESSSSAYDLNASQDAPAESLSNLVVEERETAATEYVSMDGASEIEVVSVNDPEYQTVFSDTAPEPPLDRHDLIPTEYTPPSPLHFEEPRREDDHAPLEEPKSYDEIPSPEFSTPPSFDEDAYEQPVHEPMMETAPVYSPPPAETFVPPPSAEAAFVPAAANAAMTAQMDVLFCKMADLGASDLHMSVSMPPLVRMDGKMRPLEDGAAPLTADTMRDLLTSIMPARNQEEFAERSDTDFAYEIPGLARFRCNIFEDRKGMGGVFRIIPSKILTAEQLNLSKAIMDLCGLSKGLVVVTGPTGSGKSTTLCAMVDSINKQREDHIITIEDPIEFVHENHKCLVNQREVHNHTDSFKDALRAALREDPDIVLVGEMRDLETISIAIETAETGHLVFGTLHTTTAASTVDRIIDQFPADRQQQIRVMLSESLKGVIAQTLLPKKGGGRVAALEVLIVTPAISNLIREGKTFQIPSAMQTGKNLGMVMLNDALFEHVQAGRVEPMDAYLKSVDKASFETMLTRAGIKL
jgi:twitching motility protein PilT